MGKVVMRGHTTSSLQRLPSAGQPRDIAALLTAAPTVDGVLPPLLLIVLLLLLLRALVTLLECFSVPCPPPPSGLNTLTEQVPALGCTQARFCSQNNHVSVASRSPIPCTVSNSVNLHCCHPPLPLLQLLTAAASIKHTSQPPNTRDV